MKKEASHPLKIYASCTSIVTSLILDYIFYISCMTSLGGKRRKHKAFLSQVVLLVLYRDNEYCRFVFLVKKNILFPFFRSLCSAFSHCKKIITLNCVRDNGGKCFMETTRARLYIFLSQLPECAYTARPSCVSMSDSFPYSLRIFHTIISFFYCGVIQFLLLAAIPSNTFPNSFRIYIFFKAFTFLFCITWSHTPLPALSNSFPNIY